MATKKQPAQTAAPPQLPPETPKVSSRMEIVRVANGFIVAQGYDFPGPDKVRQVARTPHELGLIVADWSAPTAKKR